MPVIIGEGETLKIVLRCVRACARAREQSCMYVFLSVCIMSCHVMSDIQLEAFQDLWPHSSFLVIAMGYHVIIDYSLLKHHGSSLKCF
jgi:hypothetical protein